MRDNQIKHDVSKIAVKTASFPTAFYRAAEESPERGAVVAIAFASDIAQAGVPLHEAFQTVCNVLGFSSLKLPRQITHYKKMPSEELANTDNLSYRILEQSYREEIAGNALSIANAALSSDPAFREDHRLNF